MQHLIDSSWNHSNQRLKGSFSVALLLHLALLLGLGFSTSPLINPAASMNVTLAQYVSDKEPDEADFLAQSNQQGSGDKGSELEASSDSQSVFEAIEQGAIPAVHDLVEQAAQVITTGLNIHRNTDEAAYIHEFEQQIELVGNLTTSGKLYLDSFSVWCNWWW